MGLTIGGDPVWTIRVAHKDLGSTPGGIHIGSTDQEVQKAYPTAQWVQNNTQLFVKTDLPNGSTAFDITFFVAGSNVSEMIITKEL